MERNTGTVMSFPHTNRPGFWFGLIDFCTAGLFFLFYMPLSGLQDELDYIVGRRTQRYWIAYLLGIPTLFIYPLVWMARIADELKAKAIEMGIEGPHTSWWHMFGWNFPTGNDRDDVQIYASLTPAKDVGGDLFDFYFRDGKLFFCIGDVSGKGIPASLFMAVTRSVFRTVSDREDMPDRIMDSLNKTIADMNDSSMFVTLFIGVLDLATGNMHYSNAGHDAPLLVGDGVSTLPCDPNIPVGIMPDRKYTLQHIRIYNGTTIFLFTDGLTEAEDVNHNMFNMHRVTDVATESLDRKEHEPRHIIAHMTDAVHRFVGNADQSDDLTMMAIQFTNNTSDQTS